MKHLSLAIRTRDFYDIIRTLDKVQKKGKTNLLDFHDVEKALVYVDLLGRYFEVFYCEVFGGYGYLAYQFDSITTKIIINKSGVTVSRCTAERTGNGTGPKFKIYGYNPSPLFKTSMFYALDCSLSDTEPGVCRFISNERTKRSK